jgi:hypothetical protein
MTDRRQWSGRAVVGLCTLGALVAACGEDEPGIFDPDSFSGMHEDEIVADCKHTVDCINQRQGASALPDDPYNTCQHDTAHRLESMPDQQTQFVHNFSRCAAFVSCEYYNCAITDAVGFGQSQMMSVSNSCEQLVSCRVTMGQSSGDPSSELANCVDSYIRELDALSSTAQQQYVNAYRGCSTLAGCDFTSCLWPTQ